MPNLGALAAVTMAYLRLETVEPSEVRLQVVTPPGPIADFALSADGKTLVFVTGTDGRSELWVRPFSASAAQRLPGTAGAELPFWSPDSRSVGFFADQKLKRIDIATGTVQTLADVSAARGGTWGNDTIVFAPANISSLMRIPARGGSTVAATQLGAEQASHRTPTFLPDGRRFLFLVSGPPTVQGIYVSSLDSPEARRLFASDSAAAFTAPDLILFQRELALMARRVDMRTLEPNGDPLTVADTVGAQAGVVGRIAVSGSAAGAFAYRPAADTTRQMVWFDRRGNRLATAGDPDDRLAAADSSWQLSPDERRIVMIRNISNNTDVWLMDVAQGTPRRFTTDAASDAFPLWSSDNSQIVFGSARLHGSVVHDLFVKSVTSADNETVLLESAENKIPVAWSPDGQFIVYTALSLKTGSDLWVLPLQSKKPFPFAQTSANEGRASFSPDGKWLAYQSTETGRFEIFVQAFPGPARSTIVSRGGGTQPIWRGREIFYKALDNRVMAIPVSIRSDAVDAGAPVELFTMRSTATFNVDRDGQRFLVNTPLSDQSTPPITVVLNWKPPGR